jgi:hypothetical protein
MNLNRMQLTFTLNLGCAALATALIACGGEDEPTASTAGSSGAAAHSGGSSGTGAGSGGVSNSGAGSSGIVSAGSGAGGMSTDGASAGGMSRAGVGGNSVGVAGGSAEAVDLELGGLNQDLPAPSVDCLTEDIIIGCMAIRGEYNGHAFELACDDRKVTVANSRSPHIACRGPIGDGDLIVELHFGTQLTQTMATTFRAETDAPNTFVSVSHLQRDFDSYPDGVFALAASHEEQFRTAGRCNTVVKSSTRTEWHVEGAFGLTLTRKSSCAADAMGFGCDEVRLRGNVRAIPLLL